MDCFAHTIQMETWPLRVHILMVRKMVSGAIITTMATLPLKASIWTALKPMSGCIGVLMGFVNNVESEAGAMFAV